MYIGKTETTISYRWYTGKLMYNVCVGSLILPTLAASDSMNGVCTKITKLPDAGIQAFSETTYMNPGTVRDRIQKGPQIS